MSAADHMGRYGDAQVALKGLLDIVRTWTPGKALAASDVALVEDGLAVVGFELLEIAGELRAEVVATEVMNREAARFLQDCHALLAKHEDEAVKNGLLPAIVADRAHRDRPAESFETDRFDVEIDAAAGVVVVRGKDDVLRDLSEHDLGPNVVTFPNRLARAIYRQGREGGVS